MLKLISINKSFKKNQQQQLRTHITIGLESLFCVSFLIRATNLYFLDSNKKELQLLNSSEM